VADPLSLPGRTRVQIVALLTGISFLLLGAFGFIPGITTHFGDIELAGEDSRAQLLGVFQVSVLLNIVHLGFGAAGIAMARTWEGARSFLIGGGVLYLALWLLGIADATEWIPTDAADDWLHLGLGVAMISVGVAFATNREKRTTRDAGRPA
jgi:hypothetical protein